jgi:two-component system, chemotaxis family, chemotaxis protein CheY
MARALVIDDSRMIRRILSHTLTQLGFEVAEAGDGREGLERLTEQGRPDLVMVDWNMPQMDGLAFLREVRSQPVHGNLCLVMLTTDDDPVQRAEARQAGANDYLLKPVSLGDLQQSLRRLGLQPG